MTTDSKAKSVKTIDEYITQYPTDVQLILNKVRSAIKEAAPLATERISYGMPGFYQNGMLVWFGGRKDFIGFYPTGEGVEAFKSQLSSYTITKGAIHFPLDQSIPYELIKKITKYRVEQNLKKKGYGK
jgi:uncharacterized protein YdhG (YjbR/CyaY superfamily)